ncbi:MAG: hypothetical protein GY711_15090 [bacterium]|nr:hypothetical protein [bacterium]
MPDPKLTLSGPSAKLTAQVRELTLYRRIDAGLAWSFAVVPAPGSVVALDSKVAELLVSGSVMASVIAGSYVVCPPCAVTGWAPADGATPIRIDAEGDEREPAEGQAPAATQPRRRVFSGENVVEILAELDAALELPEALANSLRSIAFDGSWFGTVVQDFASDWDAALHVLEQLPRLAGDSPVWPVTVTARLQGGVAGRVATWPHASAWRAIGATKQRRIAPPQASVRLAGVSPAAPYKRAFGKGELTAAIVTLLWAGRSYSDEAWTNWVARALPLFLGDMEHSVVGVRDRLYAPGAGTGFAWETELELAPDDCRLVGPRPERGLGPWSGTGVVRDGKERHPWVDVALDGFESNRNTIAGLAVSLSTGEDERGGVHMPLAPGSRVDVAWSGRLGEPLLVHGNVRHKVARFPSPSIDFETQLGLNVPAVHATRMERLTIETACGVESNNPLVLTAAGARLAMNGSVRTSKA